MAESICETVGKIHKSTGAVDEDKGHLIRVWVTLVITLPLCRGRLVTLVNSTKSWVSFKYKRLSNLCYWCSRLNQDDKHCDLWVQSKGSLKAEHQQFGPSLRAPPYTSAGKDVIFVPGYYDQRPMKSAEMPRGQGDHPNEPEDVGDSESQTATPNMETIFGGEDINAENFQNSNVSIDIGIPRNN